MFFKVAPFFFFFAAAVAAPPGGTNQCNTGNAQCCNQLYNKDSTEVKNIAGNLVGLGLGDITGMVGLECSPLTVIGATVSSNCNAKAACCTDINQVGLINVGCVPLQLL